MNNKLLAIFLAALISASAIILVFADSDYPYQADLSTGYIVQSDYTENETQFAIDNSSQFLLSSSNYVSHMKASYENALNKYSGFVNISSVKK